MQCECYCNVICNTIPPPSHSQINDIEIAKALIAFDADVNSTNVSRKTPLDLVLESDCPNLDLRDLLLRLDARKYSNMYMDSLEDEDIHMSLDQQPVYGHTDSSEGIIYVMRSRTRFSVTIESLLWEVSRYMLHPLHAQKMNTGALWQTEMTVHGQLVHQPKEAKLKVKMNNTSTTIILDCSKCKVHERSVYRPGLSSTTDPKPKGNHPTTCSCSDKHI